MRPKQLISDDNRNRLLHAMHEIGAYQCAEQENAMKTKTIKLDGSVVTHADIASQDKLVAVLKSFEPHYPVLSEERDHSKNMRAIKHDGPIWVIDPLDGTKSYSEGFDEFGINVALLGAPEADGNRTALFGAVYFPAKHELYFTNKHGTATMVQFTEDGTLESSKPLKCPSKLHLDRPLHVAIGYLDSGMHHFGESYHVLAPRRHTGGYRTAQVLKGACQASSLDIPTRIWDVAALSALVNAAGGHIYNIRPDGSATDKPYLGADAARYHDGKLFAIAPYLCMHKNMLCKTDLVPVEITQRASRER